MKIDHRDRKPLVEKSKRKPPPEDPNSVAARCRNEGVKKSANTIRSLMSRYGMTFEEAVAYVPPTRSEIGRRAKRNTRWGKDVPADSEEYKLRQGHTHSKTPFPREECDK